MEELLELYRTKQSKNRSISHIEIDITQLPQDIVNLLIQFKIISKPEDLKTFAGIKAYLGDNLIYIQKQPQQVRDYNQHRYFLGLIGGSLQGKFLIDTKNPTINAHLTPEEAMVYLKAGIVHELFHIMNSARRKLEISHPSELNYKRGRVYVKFPDYPGVKVPTNYFDDHLALIDERNAYILSCKIMEKLGLTHTYVYNNERLVAKAFTQKANELISEQRQISAEYIPPEDTDHIYYIDTAGKLIKKPIEGSDSILYD